MKTKKESVANTLHIFSNNCNVYLSRNTNILKESEWHPINFHWIPVQKLQQELNYSTLSNEN